MSRRGLSLKGLKTLAADAGVRGEPASWKTTEQIKEYILSSTRSPPQSYADALSMRPGGESLVGPANVFVSHA